MKTLFAYRDRATPNGCKCSSFANPCPKWLRNSQQRCSCIPFEHICMRTPHNRNVLSVLLLQLISSILLFSFSLSHPHSLARSLSLLRGKRASLIMHNTDSTLDQRIPPAFDPTAKLSGSKMDMEIPRETDLMDHSILFREFLARILVWRHTVLSTCPRGLQLNVERLASTPRAMVIAIKYDCQWDYYSLDITLDSRNIFKKYIICISRDII